MSHELDQIVDGLKQSPLFWLSLASKELFHSNFLAWLCETYPDHVGRLFATFVGHAPRICEGLGVYRESHNIDLLLRYPGGAELVIENKVKSLPVGEQLEKYSAAVRDKEKTSFLLLSLARPAFLPLNKTTIQLSDGTVWQCLTYRELAHKLREVLPHIQRVNSYHGQLMDDYIHFMTHLDALRTYFAIDWDDEQRDFFGIRRDIQRVKSIRLHNLVDKLCYGELEHHMGDVLRDEGFPVIHEKLRDRHEGQEGLVLLTTDMTRGVVRTPLTPLVLVMKEKP
ncbi:MAG: PD-(D/E)XK nuclease family protein [Planctomycetes bacterium]|nr:PD-(D/E)XK nuclease family protein [Planctomycetota bacterium]